jgi:predicted phosphodiesterase
MKKTVMLVMLVLLFTACSVNRVNVRSSDELSQIEDRELLNVQARRLIEDQKLSWEKEDSLNIAYIGDTRSSTIKRLSKDDIVPAFRDMSKQMIDEDVDLIFHCGDISSMGTEIQFQNYYNFVKRIMDIYGIPFLTVVGNHEWNKIDGYKYYFTYVDSILDYNFDILDSRFLVFSNYGNNGIKNYQFTDLQLKNLKRLIDLPEDIKKLMILTHAPIWLRPSKNNGKYQNYFEFDDILIQKRLIDKTKIYCINGHQHKYAKKVENNILYLTSGGGGGPFKNPKFLGVDQQNKYFFWIKTIHDLNSNALRFKIKFRKAKLEKFAVQYNFTF